MDIIIVHLIKIIIILLDLYNWSIVVYITLNWLIFLDLLGKNYKLNSFINFIQRVLFLTVEPSINFLRKLIPINISIDFSLLILILLLGFIQSTLTIILKFFV